MRKIVLLFTILVSVKAFGQQAPPEAFTYSGIARNSGQPVTNQAISLRLSILHGSSATLDYSESQSTTTDLAGYFSVNVGLGTVLSGTFNTIDWQSGSHFLKVEADYSGGNNYTDLGTTQLLSVPYALHAKSLSGLAKIKLNGTPTTDPSLDLVYDFTGGLITKTNYRVDLANKLSLDSTTVYTADTVTFNGLYVPASQYSPGSIVAVSIPTRQIDGIFYIPLNATPQILSLYYYALFQPAYHSLIQSYYWIVPNVPSVTEFPNLATPLTITKER